MCNYKMSALLYKHILHSIYYILYKYILYSIYSISIYYILYTMLYKYILYQYINDLAHFAGGDGGSPMGRMIGNCPMLFVFKRGGPVTSFVTILC